MKMLFIKILPYLVAFVSGIVLYFLTEKLITDSGLNNLMVNIASGLVSIPMVFIFYDVINKITSRNLHNSIFESVTFEINSQLVELITFISGLLGLSAPSVTEELDDFLELENNEIYQKLNPKNPNIKILEDIKSNLMNVIHKQTAFEILNEKQISSILNIIKEITFLIKNLNNPTKSKLSIKHKKIISLNIEYIINNLTTWIENGKKDAFSTHAHFSLERLDTKQEK